MESYIMDWLNLLFRWLHIITGAAWIGASFYFNWLNHSIRPPEEKQDGIKGQLFAVHGGAFYQVLKYAGAPAKLPKVLHWFKWEAYFTWITGFSLLIIVYYWNAKLYMINSSVMALQPWQAISMSVAFIVTCWVVYDQMCKSDLRKSPAVFAGIGFVLLTGVAFALSHIFAPRAAYIHMGVIIGTMMAANVFFVIIPNQRLMVDAMIAGDEPDLSKGEAGALRSLHNNYFTLPVLFIMVSNHFPMTYGHKWNWAILAALSLIGAGARHYFNLKHNGENKVWILPTAALAMVALAMVSRPQRAAPASARAGHKAITVTYGDVAPVLKQRCVPCHAAKPTYPGFVAPPLGSMLETPEQVLALKSKIYTNVVTSKSMPPGNLTKITDLERRLIGAWIDGGAKMGAATGAIVQMSQATAKASATRAKTGTKSKAAVGADDKRDPWQTQISRPAKIRADRPFAPGADWPYRPRLKQTIPIVESKKPTTR